MIARQIFNKTMFTLLVGLGSAGFAGIAAAQGTPSSKATFAYNSLVAVPACNTTDTLGCGGLSDSGWVPILRQQIKMANQKDLFFGASLQCGIVTDIWTFNRPGEFDFACLIAGHYQAGMVGKIKVVPAGDEFAKGQKAPSPSDRRGSKDPA